MTFFDKNHHDTVYNECLQPLLIRLKIYKLQKDISYLDKKIAELLQEIKRATNDDNILSESEIQEYKRQLNEYKKEKDRVMIKMITAEIKVDELEKDIRLSLVELDAEEKLKLRTAKAIEAELCSQSHDLRDKIIEINVKFIWHERCTDETKCEQFINEKNAKITQINQEKN